MDITPEILTHARALDLETMTPLSMNERNWTEEQTAATMTSYIARALKILQRVGLSPTGVTSPWDFGIGVEEEYRVAIRQARFGIGVGQTWYFLHADVRQNRAPLARRLATGRQVACQSLGSG